MTVVLLHDLGDPVGGARFRSVAPPDWIIPDLPGHGSTPVVRTGHYDPMSVVAIARWSLARPNGELVYVNPAYARHFGQTPATMIGMNLFDYVEPGDHDAVRALVARVLQTGQSTSSENRMVAADGSERWGRAA